MNSTIDVVGPTRVHLLIEVPVEELDPCLHDLRGFRAGRLPFHAIDQRLGGVVLPTELESAILRLASAAEAEHGLEPLGRIGIEIVECGPDRPLRFTASLDRRPEIVLPDLSSIVVQLGPATVEESEVDDQLDRLRTGFAAWTGVGRPIATGDLVRLDLCATDAGGEISQATAVAYEIGSADLSVDLGVDPELLSKGLDECLVGLSAGGSTSMAVPLLDGRGADLAVTVTSVQELRRPELDDELAARAGGFATLSELRDAVRTGIGRAKHDRRLTRMRDDALDRIAASVPEPGGVVDDEVEQRWQHMLAGFDGLGTTLDDYLDLTGTTEARVRAEIRDVAARKVRGQLVLDAVADAENIGVSREEVDQTIAHRATRVGIPATFYYEQLARGGALDTVIADVRRAKALSIVLQSVSIVDTDGNPVPVASADVVAQQP